MKCPVTVLMCVYNGSAFLEEAIESILDQTFYDFEFLIIDDGSTDESARIVEKFLHRDNRIVFIQQENIGLTASLNRGLREARGKWIARMDADDIAFPDRLEVQYQYVKKHSNIVLLGSGFVEINKEGEFVKEHLYDADHNVLVGQLEHLGAFFPHSSAFFLKKYVMSIGGYRDRFIKSQDHDLWLRISEKGRISCYKGSLVKIRKHPGAISCKKNGHSQRLLALAATVCYFLRRFGCDDPSQLAEDQWVSFLEWVDSELKKTNLYKESKSWNRVRHIYYSHHSFCVKLLQITFLCIRNPCGFFFNIFFNIRCKIFPPKLAFGLAKKYLKVHFVPNSTDL